MSQLDLFSFEEPAKEPTERVRTDPLPASPRPPLQDKRHYLQRLSETLDLWDMRAWKEYANPDHVRAFIRYCRSGCLIDIPGPTAQYLMVKVIELKASDEEILQAIVDNPNVRYEHRLAQCWRSRELCGFFKTFKRNDCLPCHRCRGKADEQKESLFRNAVKQWEQANNMKLSMPTHFSPI